MSSKRRSEIAFQLVAAHTIAGGIKKKRHNMKIWKHGLREDNCISAVALISQHHICTAGLVKKDICVHRLTPLNDITSGMHTVAKRAILPGPRSSGGLIERVLHAARALQRHHIQPMPARGSGIGTCCEIALALSDCLPTNRTRGAAELLAGGRGVTIC